MRISLLSVLVLISGSQVFSRSGSIVSNQEIIGSSEMSSEMSKSVSTIINERGATDEKFIRALSTEESLAEVLARKGKLEEAETMLRDSLKTRQTVLGQTTDNEDVRRIMNNLCGVIGDDRLEEKEAIQRQVLEGDKRMLGEDDFGTIVSMSNLANYLGRLGKHKEAEDLMRHAVKVSESTRGADHPETVHLIGNMIGILKDAGKDEESKQLHHDFPVLEQKVEERSKKNDEKEQSCREAIAKAQTDTEKMDALRNLIRYLKGEGRYSDAEPVCQQLVELSNNVKGVQDPDVQGYMGMLAHIVRHQRKFDEAEKILRNLLAIQKAQL